MSNQTWHTVALRALDIVERLAPLLIGAALGVSVDGLLLAGRAAELVREAAPFVS